MVFWYLDTDRCDRASLAMLGRRLLADKRAQDLAEYGIALAVVGALAVAAAISIGTRVGSLWDAAHVAVEHGEGHHDGGGNSGNGGGNAP